MAAPSPSTMPLRSRENGLHEAGALAGSILASVCSASHALSEPSDSGASAPPATDMSRSPRAMRSHASPMATADEEHAVA